MRATAINRFGARLVGVRTEAAGALAFALAAGIGALSGVLIGPVTALYYDSGFTVGVKGFVGTVIGGMVSFPLSLLGALLVGVIETFGSFYASAYKEVLVYALLIPFLLWRSAVSRAPEETGPVSGYRAMLLAIAAVVAALPLAGAAGPGDVVHLYRHRLPGRDRAGAADGGCRANLVRPGGVLRA